MDAELTATDFGRAWRWIFRPHRELAPMPPDRSILDATQVTGRFLCFCLPKCARI